MITLATFIKSPDEIKRYVLEYSRWLDSGEYVGSVSFTTISSNTGALSFAPDVIGVNDTDIQVLVSGGTIGETYRVRARMTSDSGQVKEDVLEFIINSTS